MDADGANQTRLTFTGRDEKDLAWSPDGSLIAFSRSGPTGPYQIFTIDPETGEETQLTSLGSNVWLSWQSVPPPGDFDRDGIADALDPEPTTRSTSFADAAGTSGSIQDAAGLAVTIEDAADPEGVRVVVGAGVGKVTLRVCGGFVLKLAAGSEATISCGSVTVSVVEGEAEVVLGEGHAVVSLPADVTARVTDNGDGTFAVENLGGGPVTLTVGGVQTEVAAGETKPVTVPGSAMLVIDEDSIDNGSPPNHFSAQDVNDQVADIGLRSPLPALAGANVGRTYTLFTGQVGDEAWFALTHEPASWAAAGPTGDALRNFRLAGPGLGSPDANGDRESLLDKVRGVTPLRATGLAMLVGRQVCAVVYDGDVGINYVSLNGDLSTEGTKKGSNLGIVAFKVLSAIQLTGYSSGALPKVDVRVLSPDKCDQGLTQFDEAPAPRSSSDPYDVAP
jgi:hypothetical protein